jgi:SAM-dependent methyltransferase
MHKAAYEWIADQVADKVTNTLRVLEIGSYDVNGSVRDLFTGAQYVGIDRRPGRGVDIVCDARDLDHRAVYDIVLSTEVLEHEPDPAQIVACARRALRRGGLLLLTAASPERQPHGCDGGPVGKEHYAGVSAEAIRAMLRGWRDIAIEVHPERGDIYARAVRP